MAGGITGSHTVKMLQLVRLWASLHLCIVSGIRAGPSSAQAISKGVVSPGTGGPCKTGEKEGVWGIKGPWESGFLDFLKKWIWEGGAGTAGFSEIIWMGG